MSVLVTVTMRPPPGGLNTEPKNFDEYVRKVCDAYIFKKSLPGVSSEKIGNIFNKKIIVHIIEKLLKSDIVSSVNILLRLSYDKEFFCKNILLKYCSNFIEISKNDKLILDTRVNSLLIISGIIYNTEISDQSLCRINAIENDIIHSILVLLHDKRIYGNYLRSVFCVILSLSYNCPITCDVMRINNIPDIIKTNCMSEYRCGGNIYIYQFANNILSIITSHTLHKK